MVYFERINIRGNTKTRDKVIRREMRIFEGELYNQTLLDYLEAARHRARLLREGRRVDQARARPTTMMEVNVEVAERPTGTFQIGAGFSSVENFIAQAQISQNNLFGRGQMLTAAGAAVQPAPAVPAAVPGAVLPRHQLDVRLQPVQARTGSCSRSSAPRRAGSLTWGYLLADDTRLLLTYTLEDVGVSTGGFTRPLLQRGAAADADRARIANLFRSGVTSSGRGVAVRTTRATTACSRPRGWYNTDLGRDRRHVPALREHVHPLRGGRPRASTRSGGPSCCGSRPKRGLIASRDPRGVPIFERYFVGGIYDIRGFAAALARAGHPRALRPIAGLAAAQLPGRRQHEGDRQRRDRVPDVREGRDPRRRVHRHGQRVQPRGSVLQRSVRRPSTVSKDPCMRPARPGRRTAQSWGFGFRWFSPIGPLRFEWGIPFRTAARRAADGVRVHDRQLLLNVLSRRRSPVKEITTCHASSRFCWSLSLLLAARSSALAEDMKLGYVDMQRALNETEDGRKAKASLKKVFDQKQKELDEQQAAAEEGHRGPRQEADPAARGQGP